MKKEKRLYSVIYTIASIVLRPFYWIKPVGRENLPEGAAILCGNHSSWTDPFLIAFALGRGYQLHMMAKKELFKSRIVGGVLKGIGSFSVDRGAADFKAIKTALRYLKAGEKVGIFPEGTRCKDDGMAQVKHGAVRIAEKAGVPVIPVYIPRKKKIFSTMEIVIGKPYYINPEKKRLSSEEYDVISEELMSKINLLHRGAC